MTHVGSERATHENSPFLDEKHGGGRGESLLRFLIEALKEPIDADFRTMPDRPHTGIAGSSMGGLSACTRCSAGATSSASPA